MHEYLREVDKLWKWCILPGPLEMWRRRDSWDSVKEWDTHPHTFPHTHSHSYIHSHTQTYTFTHIPTRSLHTHSHISTHTYSHSFSQLLSHTFSHPLSHTPTLLPGHAHTRPLMLSLTHTFSHVHTYLLTLTPNRTHSNLHTFSHPIHTLSYPLTLTHTPKGIPPFYQKSLIDPIPGYWINKICCLRICCWSNPIHLHWLSQYGLHYSAHSLSFVL